MKKLLFTTIFILTGLYVSAQNGVIERVTGTVEIKQPQETSFIKANGGAEIFQETVISTSFKSLAVIRVGSTTITVRPLTLMSLTEIQKSAETETLHINLQTGRVRVDVKPPAGTRASTTISSPSAVASVRGTSFEFDTSNLYVSEGAVSFSGTRGQNILVKAGGSSRGEQTGRASNPQDGRILNLMPPSPVGTSAEDGIASGPAAAGVPFIIELDFGF
jgi:hypothetical protein